MIDFDRFKHAMLAIGTRCASTPNGEQLKMYHEYLSPLLTTDEFLSAARGVWSSAEFFPPPNRFLESRSRSEWENLTKLLDKYTPPNVSSYWHEHWMALSEHTRLAVKRLGGPLAFKEQSYNRDVARAYDLFTTHYTQALEDLATGTPLGEPDENKRLTP